MKKTKLGNKYEKMFLMKTFKNRRGELVEIKKTWPSYDGVTYFLVSTLKPDLLDEKIEYIIDENGKAIQCDDLEQSPFDIDDSIFDEFSYNIVYPNT